MWMKVDDGLNNHRKTRAVTRSHDDKRRDIAPMGLWIASGSWAAQNRTEGWVPEDELDRWDDDWENLAARLVAAGYWWREERSGDAGYGFHDWHDYNDPGDLASRSGTLGNHVRWHVNKGIADPECDHCPKEPIDPESAPDIAPDSGGESHPTSGGESRSASPPIALPLPDPLPDPIPEPELLPATAVASEPDRFDEFWDTYGKKRDRKGAEAKWRQALKKSGVTADRLIDAAAAYVLYERTFNQGGRYVMDPARWLNGERWNDERPSVRAPQTRTQEHLALVQQLRADEQGGGLPQIGGGER